MKLKHHEMTPAAAADAFDGSPPTGGDGCSSYLSRQQSAASLSDDKCLQTNYKEN